MMLHSALSMLEVKLDGGTHVFTPEESLRVSVVPGPTNPTNKTSISDRKLGLARGDGRCRRVWVCGGPRALPCCLCSEEHPRRAERFPEQQRLGCWVGHGTWSGHGHCFRFGDGAVMIPCKACWGGCVCAGNQDLMSLH